MEIALRFLRYSAKFYSMEINLNGGEFKNWFLPVNNDNSVHMKYRNASFKRPSDKRSHF